MTAYTARAIRTHVRAEERLASALAEYRVVRGNYVRRPFPRGGMEEGLAFGYVMARRSVWSSLAELLAEPTKAQERAA